MPEYTCTQCHAKHYGWATSDKCTYCGGKLIPVDKEKWDFVKEGRCHEV